MKPSTAVPQGRGTKGGVWCRETGCPSPSRTRIADEILQPLQLHLAIAHRGLGEGSPAATSTWAGDGAQQQLGATWAAGSGHMSRFRWRRSHQTP